MSANNQKQKTDLQVDQQIDQLASGIPPLHLSTKFPSDFPFQMPEEGVMGIMRITQQTNRLIPPPDELIKYPEEFQKAFLESLSAPHQRAAKEQEHRHHCENKKIELEEKMQIETDITLRIFALLGTFVLFSTIIGSVVCAYFGMEKAAIALASTAVISVCSAFFKVKDKNTDKKEENNEEEKKKE